jgi:hypothetical protein
MKKHNNIMKYFLLVLKALVGTLRAAKKKGVVDFQG